MLDLGFSEILLVAVVALLVLGPEQMLSLLRNLGLWVRRFRVYSARVKDDIDKELNLGEMRKHMRKLEQSARDPLSLVDNDELGLSKPIDSPSAQPSAQATKTTSKNAASDS